MTTGGRPATLCRLLNLNGRGGVRPPTTSLTHGTNDSMWDFALIENVNTRPLPSRDKAVPIPREGGFHPSVKGSRSFGEWGSIDLRKVAPALGKGVAIPRKGCSICRKRDYNPSKRGAPCFGKGVSIPRLKGFPLRQRGPHPSGSW